MNKIKYGALGTVSTISGSNVVCGGNQLYTYSIQSVANAVAYNWAVPEGATIIGSASGTNIQVRFSANTTNNVKSENITVQVSVQCTTAASKSSTLNVNVNPTPTLSSSLTPAAVCNGSAFVYEPSSSVTGTTFSWTRAAVGGNAAKNGTGSISEILVNTGSSPITVTYAYTLLSASGCSNTQNVSVTVNPTPPPVLITVNGPRSYCPITTPSRTNLSVATATGYTYQWYRDGNPIPNADIFNYSPPVTGDYTVRVTNQYGCSTFSNTERIELQEILISNGSIELYNQTTIEPGKPASYKVSSQMQDRGHALSYKWYMIRNGLETVVGGNSEILNIPSVPNEEFFLRCDITPISGVCYDPTPLRIETTPINPLPVEIIYFTAAKQGNNVLLEWATASEENNTGFEVQVSQDGFNFRKLDFVPTKNGNTVIKQLYTFKDTENGKYGTRYYRLKQIDMDGQFEYFTTKAVSFGEVSNYSLKAFPNPFEGEVNLELNADESGKLNVQVLDAMGRSVMTQQFEVSKGRSLEKITLWQSLPKGIYFVRTEMNGQANNFKLLKK